MNRILSLAGSLRRIVANPIAFILLGVLLLLPFLYIGRYDHPLSDDFLNVVWDSLWLKNKELYLKWSGRYFSDFILTWTPVHYGSIKGYQYLILFFIALNSFSILFAVRKLLACFAGMDRFWSNCIALFCSFVFLNNVPVINELFYWYPAVIAYTLTLFFATVLFYTIDRDFRNARSRRGRSLIEAFSIFAIIGCSEVSMVGLDLALGMLFCYALATGNTAMRRHLLFLLAVAAVCSAISVFAPGNSARQSLSHPSRVKALAFWLFFTKERMLMWLYDPFFVLMSWLLLIAPAVRPRRVLTARYSLPGIFAVTLVLVYAMMFPNYWVAAAIGPGRVLNTVYFVFFCGVILLLRALHGVFADRLPAPGLRSGKSQAILILTLLLFATLVTTRAVRETNYGKALSMIQRRIPQRYDAELQARYRILSSATTDTVGIPSIKARQGNLLLYEDLWSVPNEWPNTAYETYWKRKAVFLNDTLAPPNY